MAFRQVSWLGPSTVVGGDAAFSRVSAQWRIRRRFKSLTVAAPRRGDATFASLRLSENRRLNEEAHSRQGAKAQSGAIYSSKTISRRYKGKRRAPEGINKEL
jgi:hypothetical protein